MKSARGEKVENIITLARGMMASSEGVTLDDIRRMFSVSRRTAERMRDTVSGQYHVEEAPDAGDRKKRWRISSTTSTPELNVTAEELAELHNAIELLKMENLVPNSKLLDNLYTKIKARLGQRKARVETDLEALLESEGLAMRPGPRVEIKKGVLGNLRSAVLARQRVWLHYRRVGSKEIIKQHVCPYGFLYGHRHYLVAYSFGMKGYRLWALGNIERVDITGKDFERRDDFSLKEYAERSFGVFQEEPFDVEWRFNKKVADIAEEFQFHPTQTTERRKDGSLVVRFRAGGALEMAWHLYTWGENVKVVKPKDFWERVEKQGGRKP